MKCAMCISYQDRLRVFETTIQPLSQALQIFGHLPLRTMPNLICISEQWCSSGKASTAMLRSTLRLQRHLLSSLDASSEQRLKKKFEIAYLLCKQSLAFTKMAPVCELEEKYGVDLGSGYKNDQACATFVSYIAQEQRQLLACAVAKAKIFLPYKLMVVPIGGIWRRNSF